MMFSYINLVVISLEKYSTGSSSSHLVTYSTVVMIYHAPVHLASVKYGPMKSITQISNVKLGFTNIKGIHVLGRGRPSCWHWSHLFKNSRQSWRMIGHHNTDCCIFMVVVSS